MTVEELESRAVDKYLKRTISLEKCNILLIGAFTTIVIASNIITYLVALQYVQNSVS
jgi:hypothetical protein